MIEIGTRAPILVGMHNPELSQAYSMVAESKGYEVCNATNINELRAKLVEGQKYRAILMDPNLGDWDGSNIEALQEVLIHLNDKLGSGETALMTITGRSDLVDTVRGMNLPCENKFDFPKKVSQWLDSLS